MANDYVRAMLRRHRNKPLMEARAAYQAALEDVKRCTHALAVYQVRHALDQANIVGYVAMMRED